MTPQDPTIEGLWWLPEKPKERWVGRLTCRQGRSLQLDFTVPEGRSNRVPDAPKVFHGVDENNQPVTLLFPGRTNQRQSAALTTYEFSVGYAVRGLQLKSAAALKLHDVSMRLEFLHDWIGRTGFDQSPQKGSDWNIRYKRPKDLRFKLKTGLSLKITTQVRGSSSLRTHEIEEATGLRLQFKAGAGFQEINDWVEAVRGLLHFSIFKPVHLIKLDGRKNRHGQSFGSIFVPHEIEILSAANRPGSAEAYNHPSDFVFCFSDVSPNFATFFAQWMEYAKQYGAALGCYYTTVYHSQVKQEEFLSLTRALDAYWGIKNAQRDDNDFPKKIRDLVTTHHTHMAQWVPDISAFVDRVKATRHYHTHYGAKWANSGKVVEGPDLTRLTVHLKILFQICVLSDLRIPPARFSRLHRQIPTRVTEYKA